MVHLKLESELEGTHYLVRVSRRYTPFPFILREYTKISLEYWVTQKFISVVALCNLK